MSARTTKTKKHMAIAQDVEAAKAILAEIDAKRKLYRETRRKFLVHKFFHTLTWGLWTPIKSLPSPMYKRIPESFWEAQKKPFEHLLDTINVRRKTL